MVAARASTSVSVRLLVSAARKRSSCSSMGSWPARMVMFYQPRRPQPGGTAAGPLAGRLRSERQHAADQCPPGHLADDAVDGDPECLLETTHRRIGLGP